MINELLFLSKNDIPFKEAQVNIHQPTIKEISLIGEESFHIGCQFLNFSKDSLSEEDKIALENKSDFDIFMSIINSPQGDKYKFYTLLILTLLFPNFNLKFATDKIILQQDDFITSINSNNFSIFKDIIVKMFALEQKNEEGKYNPSDGLARKIAEKLEKRHKKLAEQKGVSLDKIAIFSRYVSILAVGNKKDMNELMNYTVYQLKDEFKRFQLKQSFDIYLQAKMAGAKDLEEVDNWMDDIHP